VIHLTRPGSIEVLLIADVVAAAPRPSAANGETYALQRRA
jgi:hypothetical protein